MDSVRSLFVGEANREREMMVFDWVKAAEIIKSRGVMNAAAGLRQDWESGGSILFDGKPVSRDDTYTCLASTWATPELIVDGGDPIPCFRMQREVPEWDAQTFWPEEALAILAGV